METYYQYPHILFILLVILMIIVKGVVGNRKTGWVTASSGGGLSNSVVLGSLA